MICFSLQFRRLIWESNLRYIQQHNLEADRGLHTYVLGENEYCDMVSQLTTQLNIAAFPHWKS